MRMISEIEVAGRKVQVREITVGEAREFLAGLEQTPSVDTIGMLLFEDCSLQQLAFMTDLSVDDLNAFTPSALREVVDAAMKMNPSFFAMLERGAKIAASLAPLTSNASAASS